MNDPDIYKCMAPTRVRNKGKRCLKIGASPKFTTALHLVPPLPKKHERQPVWLCRNCWPKYRETWYTGEVKSPQPKFPGT